MIFATQTRRYTICGDTSGNDDPGGLVHSLHRPCVKLGRRGTASYSQLLNGEQQRDIAGVCALICWRAGLLEYEQQQ